MEKQQKPTEVLNAPRNIFAAYDAPPKEEVPAIETPKAIDEPQQQQFGPFMPVLALSDKIREHARLSGDKKHTSTPVLLAEAKASRAQANAIAAAFQVKKIEVCDKGNTLHIEEEPDKVKKNLMENVCEYNDSEEDEEMDEGRWLLDPETLKTLVAPEDGPVAVDARMLQEGLDSAR